MGGFAVMFVIIKTPVAPVTHLFFGILKITNFGHFIHCLK